MSIVGAKPTSNTILFRYRWSDVFLKKNGSDVADEDWNTLKPKENGRHFVDICKLIYLKAYIGIWYQNSLKFVALGLVDKVSIGSSGYGFGMMTSSNGNIFRVTGHLCGEFTGTRWISTKASGAKLWSSLWINGWVNNREAGDLRRYRVYYDVTVMDRRLWGFESLIYFICVDKNVFDKKTLPHWIAL